MEDLWNSMYVLMPVKVRQPDARRGYLLKLCPNLSFQVDQPDSPPQERLQQVEWMMVQKAARVGEAWNLVMWGHGVSLCQIQMKTGIQQRILFQDINRRFEGAAVDDQAGGRHNALSMRFRNGFIDLSRKAKIVCCDDQQPLFKRRSFIHGFALSGSPFARPPTSYAGRSFPFASSNLFPRQTMRVPAYDRIQIASEKKSRVGMSHRVLNTRRSPKTKYPEAIVSIPRKTRAKNMTPNPGIEGAAAKDKRLHGKAKVRTNPA